MDKETNQENPSHIPNNITTTTTTITTNIKEESPRKPLIGGRSGGGNNNNGGGGSDRLKRDEWSEGAVSSLLEAYETKWVLRNRAKLKGHDWEDVARYVSSRSNSTKSPKTQTQCKNKIESMKKRYRSESATADASSWPLYPRLDLLLRGNGPSQVAVEAASVAPSLPQTPVQAAVLPAPLPQLPPNPPLMLLEPSTLVPPPPPPQPPTLAPPPPLLGTQQNSHGSNGLERLAKEDEVLLGTNLSDHGSDKNNPIMETDSSTPALYSEKKERLRSKKMKMKMEHKSGNYNKKRRIRKEEYGVAESIRWLAEVVVKSEQARMETMREIEKMRVEAEAKRGEMDLKRTEIIANTQLEIAKLFATGVGKGVDSSLRIGRN